MKDTAAEDDSSIANIRPWKDEETLRHYYWKKGHSLRETGSQLGCTKPTVRDWMDKHDIPIRNGSRGWSEPWDGESELRELYIEDGLSTYDIADKYGCGASTVHRYLIDYEIPLRRTGPPRSTHPHIRTSSRGYEVAESEFYGSCDVVKIHRLLAIHKYGFEEVKGMSVHHKNNCSWDNRPENIELMTPSEHTTHHHESGDIHR